MAGSSSAGKRLRLLVVAIATGAALVRAEAVPPIIEPNWAELSPQKKQILEPLAGEWDRFDAQKRQKWLAIADRYPGLGLDEQQRIQDRMKAWAKLTPEQRYAARQRYKSVQKATPEQRLALKAFAQRMSGDLLGDIVRIESEPIAFAVTDDNIHTASATLSAGTLAKIETRAINAGDHICHNEETWYRPLTKVDHAMPAYALANSYKGTGLGTTWSSPEKRSAFVGSFSLND